MATPIHKFKTHSGSAFRIPSIAAPTIDSVQVDMTSDDWGGWIFTLKDAQVNSEDDAILDLADVSDDTSGFTINSATDATLLIVADDIPAIGEYHYSMGFTYNDITRYVLHGQFVVEG